MAVMPPDQASAEPPGWETIEELFSALESPLLNYALRLVGQVSIAEDMVQEAFMRLHGQFDQVREPRRWLYRTVHNLALNQRRDAAKIVPLPLGGGGGGEGGGGAARPPPLPLGGGEGAKGCVDAADPQPLPDEQIARMEGIGLVRLSLETLDERSREVVRLKFNEDLSYKEISARTGLGVGHEGYLLHHALKAIAEELAKNGVVP